MDISFSKNIYNQNFLKNNSLIIETDLITHFQKAAKSQFQHNILLEGNEVPHVLQHEKSWSVVVAVTQI